MTCKYQNCTSLCSIRIPKGVTNIGLKAFDGVDITTVKSMIENPFAINKNCFSKNTIMNATLFVQAGSLSKYKETIGWKDFVFIEEFVFYKLTYMVDGEVYKRTNYEYGEVINPLSYPIKEGYTFSGWSEIPETMPANDITITGSFTINSYKLMYEVDGEDYKTVELEYGAAITPEEEPIKEGYTFSGWSEIPETMPSHVITVKGTFTVNAYKLTYEVDGREYKTIEMEYGAAITPEQEPTKEGYTFSGWSEIPETMPAHDVIVKGSFTINTYNLTYMIDEDVYKIVEYDFGATITPEPQPEGDYIRFEWVGRPETMPANDVTVYADYETGIGTISNESSERYYRMDGTKTESQSKGFHIVVRKNVDGTRIVKKVFVR